MTDKNEETEPAEEESSVSSQLYRSMLLRPVFVLVLDWFLGHIPSLLNERSLRRRAKNSSCFITTYITLICFSMCG